jgi:quinol monooxygenase YgiN
MIHIIASIEVKPDTRAAFLEAFHALVPAVHAEDGCIEYGPTVDAKTDIDIQLYRENVVTIMEKWESLDHLKAHLKAPHMDVYRESVKDIVVGMQLQILEPA